MYLWPRPPLSPVTPNSGHLLFLLRWSPSTVTSNSGHLLLLLLSLILFLKKPRLYLKLSICLRFTSLHLSLAVQTWTWVQLDPESILVARPIPRWSALERNHRANLHCPPPSASFLCRSVSADSHHVDPRFHHFIQHHSHVDRATVLPVIFSSYIIIIVPLCHHFRPFPLFPLGLLYGRNGLWLVITVAYWVLSSVIAGSSVDFLASLPMVLHHWLHLLSHCLTLPRHSLYTPLLLHFQLQIRNY